MTELFPRHARLLAAESLAYSPVVFILGARQVGKSTLAHELVIEHAMAESLSLDTKTVRDTAIADPSGFVASLGGPALIDEIQRAPELLFAIKEDVDRNRQPGRYLLTGSANVLTAPKIHEALTGRAALVTLWPLAQSEIEGSGRNVVDALFSGEVPRVEDAPVGRQAFARRVAEGGYPNARLAAPRQRRRLFADYVTSTLQRDLREIADARKLDEMPRLLRLIAARTGNIYQARNIASSLGLSHETIQSYTRLLETVFLVRRIPSWRPGIGNRELHAPKVHVVDSGLLASLLGADEQRIADDDQLTGKLLESFVAMEIAKHVDWAETSVTQYHYRDRRDEVDIVLESHSGELAAIEVKASATVRPQDWRAIANLRDARSSAFRAGIVMYSGERTIPLSKRIWAVPVSWLWS